MHYKTREHQTQNACEPGTNMEHVLEKTNFVFLQHMPTSIYLFITNASKNTTELGRT